MRVALLLACLISMSAEAGRSVRVKSYTTKRGTYVAPSYRTKSDRTRLNNYSTKGNFNPYSGKKGTRKAWK